ncbi:MAG: 5-methyltetrahydropteroyltriglutamate--homocysteine S-methyltransferase [Chloroflexota bacterium]|nr:5-methyltetrahydropteroyltriglutamate--homocysteine S-methyltransferase [Chloroflexota bacterium]
MTLATIPGYPRIGRNREMKKALEEYWSGKVSEADLLSTAAQLRQENWRTQAESGIELIPINDFTLYDQVLDTAALVGAVPVRYGWNGGQVDLDTYFAMARGRTGERDVRALDMTKWFDTNYHYIVPELTADQQFTLSSEKPFAELEEAKAAGVQRPKVVLVGPATFLLLSKTPEGAPVPFHSLLERLTPVYAEVIRRLAAQGAEWIQLDEIALVQDRTPEELAAIGRAYSLLGSARGSAKLLVHTAFGHVGEAYNTLVNLDVDGVGLDLVRGRHNLDLIRRSGYPDDKWLAAGVVDGRNVWTNDLAASLALLRSVQEESGVSADRLMVSSSSSLQHVPIDASREDHLDPELRSWLAFAEQKLHEVAVLKRAIDEGENAVQEELHANRRIIESRANSPRRNNARVRERLEEFAVSEARRPAAYAERSRVQQEQLKLPPLPTTTIGSFPQTGEVRAMRRRLERGEIGASEYEGFIEEKIREVIRLQEELGLDVLVHGEFERNDMVQYFGEQLEGFAFTRYGWVQSYGSRYVRPPIIYGDVHRPQPMTVRWSTFTQGLTDRPVKGMLTGPVTILNWSFVRDDQPRSETCRQIALAIRDEVQDLEAAGIGVIQIDEPALREGLPLRHADWDEYLRWSVDAFRLTASGVRNETQIHTHMCYSEFRDVIGAISDLDADVIFIENARSDLEMLDVFRSYGYDKGVGPGVYDIHSPRVPPVEELAQNLRQTVSVLDNVQVWVNPDCGLKTRRPEEVQSALRNMVAAAQQLRNEQPNGHSS